MRVFTFDWESFLIQPGKHAPKGVCVSFCNEDLDTKDPRVSLAHANFDRSDLHDIFDDALKNADIINGANLAFDLGLVWQEFPDLAPRIWDAYQAERMVDVLLNEKLIDIGKGILGMHFHQNVFKNVRYNLADVTQRRLGVFLEKDEWRLIYGTLWNIPISQWQPGARQYSAFDTKYAHLVLVDQVSEKRYLRDSHRQAKAAWWMHLMTCRGFRVEGKSIETLATYVQGEIDKLQKFLFACQLVDGKGKKNSKIAAARMETICAQKGIEVPRTDPSMKFPNGQVQITDAACTETQDPQLLAYARYTSLSNIKSKDILALAAAAKAGMPIQSNFDVIKETGRTGSSGGKKKKGVMRTSYGYQLQNVRRGVEDADGVKLPGVRECFVPRKGFHLLSIDYGQMELHAWAQVCITLLGYSRLAESLNKGIDVHSQLGAQMIGRSYEDVVKNKKNKKEPWAADARQMAKAGNFGYPGGLGTETFVAFAKASYGIDITLEQATKLRAVWYETWKEARDYFNRIKAMVEMSPHGGIVQLKSDRYRGRTSFTKAANGMFQGLAADCAKDAGFRLARACYATTGPLSGSYIVDFIHDEFLFEVPIEKAHEAAHAANDIMEEAGRIWMPDVPPKSEPALMYCWTKEAATVYEDGRLVPWVA